MELSRRLQAAKRDLLVPCVYHFYQRPPALVRGEGAYLFDEEGRCYLDCFAGVTVMNAGHSNSEIIEAAIDQLRRLQHTTTVYLTEPMLELAARLAELAPPACAAASSAPAAARPTRGRCCWPPWPRGGARSPSSTAACTAGPRRR